MITYREIGGSCPTQATGDVDGHPFYFRARHGDWTFDIALPGGDPIFHGDAWWGHGDDPTHGWMEEDAVRTIIEDEVAQWEANSRQPLRVHGCDPPPLSKAEAEKLMAEIATDFIQAQLRRPSFFDLLNPTRKQP